VHVTLARFGNSWLESMLAACAVRLEVAHLNTESNQQDLMVDFLTLITSFDGPLYVQRSMEPGRRFLAAARAANGQGHVA
jgi:predicted site-specific integrase-resolvase